MNRPSPNASLDFSPLLKPLLVLLLFLLLILSALCLMARTVVNNEVSQIVVEQAHTLLQTPTSLPATRVAPAATPPPLPIAQVSPAAIPAAATSVAVALGALIPLPSPDEEEISTLGSALTSTSTPISTLRAMLTPIPTLPSALTSTPTPSPTPIVSGLVIANQLNVRQGPGTNYGYAAGLEQGDKVIVLGRTPTGDWLEIETPDRRRGWVAARQIEISGDITAIKIATALERLSPTEGQLLPLQLDGRSVSGEIGPQQEQWYTFFDDDEETVIIFMFRPPGPVQFFLHGESQIPRWPPRDPAVLENIGAGSRPASDRDGNPDTAELIWRGGPLVPGARYYLRFINRSDQPIQYCLAPREVFHWSCR